MPLTVEEIQENRRAVELKNLQTFIYSKFSASASFLLNEELTWHDDKVIVEYTVDEYKFRLRPVDDDFEFFAVTDLGEIQLLQLSREDPQFSNRIMVAIGDYIS